MLKERRSRLLEYLDPKGSNVAAMFKPENIFYITGFWGEGIALCTSELTKLFVPKLEAKRAEIESKDCEVISTDRGADSINSIAPYLKEPSYSDCNDYDLITLIRNYAKDINFVVSQEPFMKCRSIKDKYELESIRIASAILDTLFKICSEEIREGMTEKDLQTTLVYEAMKLGATTACYPYSVEPLIVAGGPNSAQPHAVTSSRGFVKGDMIVVDLTLRHNHYVSDATRTFALNSASQENIHIYNTVRDAQMLGIENLKRGIKCHVIDDICRKEISRVGFHKNFIHSTGHGVGLEVHELPWIRQKEKTLLEDNMVITIEPGIYLPSKFGVRIEDTIHIKFESSIEEIVLTHFTKDLLILD